MDCLVPDLTRMEKLFCTRANHIASMMDMFTSVTTAHDFPLRLVQNREHIGCTQMKFMWMETEKIVSMKI